MGRRRTNPVVFSSRSLDGCHFFQLPKIRLFVVGIDISESEAKNSELAIAKDELLKIYEESPVLLMLRDRKGKILDISKNAAAK